MRETSKILINRMIIIYLVANISGIPILYYPTDIQVLSSTILLYNENEKCDCIFPKKHYTQVD